jgi:glycosyltransferase involved in cell wall biosynthesis
MTWFLQEVYPRIRAQAPDVSLTITGDHAGLPLPPADHVTLTGFVDDVRPLIAAAWVSLVPLRVGGGTRLKILEAMALGTPVVATSKGAEGLDAQHGEHLLIANGPEAFAESVIRLLQEPGLRRRMADNAYQLVQEKYDMAALMPRFLDLVERVATPEGNGKGLAAPGISWEKSHD